MLQPIPSNVDAEPVMRLPRLRLTIYLRPFLAALAALVPQIIPRRADKRRHRLRPRALRIRRPHKPRHKLRLGLWAVERAIREYRALVHPADDLSEAGAAVREGGAAAAGPEHEQTDAVQREEEAQRVKAWQLGSDADDVRVRVVLRPEAAACEDRYGQRGERDEGEDSILVVLVFQRGEGGGEGEARGVVE